MNRPAAKNRTIGGDSDGGGTEATFHSANSIGTTRPAANSGSGSTQHTTEWEICTNKTSSADESDGDDESNEPQQCMCCNSGVEIGFISVFCKDKHCYKCTHSTERTHPGFSVIFTDNTCPCCFWKLDGNYDSPTLAQDWYEYEKNRTRAECLGRKPITRPPVRVTVRKQLLPAPTIAPANPLPHPHPLPQHPQPNPNPPKTHSQPNQQGLIRHRACLKCYEYSYTSKNICEKCKLIDGNDSPTYSGARSSGSLNPNAAPCI